MAVRRCLVIEKRSPLNDVNEPERPISRIVLFVRERTYAVMRLDIVGVIDMCNNVKYDHN
jgi:hypothetical protein